MKLIISSLKRNGLKPIIVFIALTGALLVLSKAQTGKPQFVAPFVGSSPSPKASVLSPDYTVTTSTGAAIVPGDTDVGNHCDDCLTRNIPLPFPVFFYDGVFTTFDVSSNGHITFTDADDTDYNFCLPHDIDSLIVPLSADLYTFDAANGQGIFTSVSGTAPNRIFNIEWRTKYCCSVGTPVVNFEVRLYEGQRRIDFIYGDIQASSSNHGIGVQRDTGSQSTIVSCGSVPASGTQYTFIIPPSCAPAPAGMIAWWKGEGDATDSQGDHNGTVNGATFASGEVGQAFTFDGTDDTVSIPDSADWNFGTDEFTFDFWARATGTNRMYALEFASITDIKNLEFDFNDDHGLWVYLDSGGGTDGTNAIQFGAVGDYTDGQWHHFALTRISSTWTLYIDGVAVKTATDSEALDLSGANNNYLGAEVARNAHFWNGQIDEVEVFKHALSPTEVASLYIAGSFGKCPCTPAPDGMVSWWRAEGDFIDTADNNHGTENGTVPFASGEVGQAFSFNGDPANYVSVPPNTNLDLTQFTVDAWVYLTAYPGGEFILDKAVSGGQANYDLSIGNDDFGN